MAVTDALLVIKTDDRSTMPERWTLRSAGGGCGKRGGDSQKLPSPGGACLALDQGHRDQSTPFLQDGGGYADDDLHASFLASQGPMATQPFGHVGH